MIIAEIGLSHDGSLGTAHSYIDALANSGADAIKFQTLEADTITIKNNFFDLTSIARNTIRHPQIRLHF